MRLRAMGYQTPIFNGQETQYYIQAQEHDQLIQK